MSDVISVIVPVFNPGEHLIRCLESVVHQTYHDLDIVVVDDGSTDDSPQIIRSFAHRDPRVRLVSQANSGVSAARNAGLDAATGDYVSFLDADDWLEPNAFEVMMAEFARAPIDVVTCGYFIDHPTASQVGPSPRRFHGLSDTTSGVEFVMATPQRFACARLYRSSLVATTRFRRDLHWGEDTVFTIDVMRRAAGSWFVATPLYHYVQREGSATRSVVNPKRLSGPAMADALEQLLIHDHPTLLDYVAEMRMNLIVTLFQDFRAAPELAPPVQKEELVRLVRADLPRLISSPRIGRKAKSKALLFCAAPRLSSALRHHAHSLRGRLAR